MSGPRFPARWCAWLLLLLGACGQAPSDRVCLDEVPARPDGAFATADPAAAGRIRIRYRDGTQVEVPTRPGWIICTLPGLTETVAWLDGVTHIVGVTPWCNHPAAVEGITQVSVMPLDLERLIELQPDLLVVDRTLHRGDMDSLARRFPGVLLPLETSRSLPHLLRSMTLLAAVLDTDRARDAVAAWGARLADAESPGAEDGQRQRPSRVLIVSGWRPLNVIGAHGLMNDLLRACGCVNVACDLDLPSGTFHEELVLERQPDMILHRTETPPDALRERWGRLPAFALGRVGPCEADDLARGGPRILDALARLRAVLVEGRPMAELRTK